MAKVQVRCGHEVPCTCNEYLEGLTLDQLLNLRIQFGRVVVDATKYPEAVVVLEVSDPPIRPSLFKRSAIRRSAIRSATKMAKKINEVMERKYGCIVV